MLRVNAFVPVIGTDFAAVVVVTVGGSDVVAVVFYDVDNALILVLHLPHIRIYQCSTIWLLHVCTDYVVVVATVAVVRAVDVH